MIHFEYFEVTDACVHHIKTDQGSVWLDSERQVAVSNGLETKTDLT